MTCAVQLSGVRGGAEEGGVGAWGLSRLKDYS